MSQDQPHLVVTEHGIIRKKDWRDSAEEREAYGKALEKEFAERFRCYCDGHGHFSYIGYERAGRPDFTCDYCGQLVDVKGSPQAKNTGNIAISAFPWERYVDEVLIMTKIGDKWLGEFKAFMTPINGTPNEPTHHERHARLHDTQWYLFSWKPFRTAAELGLVDTSQ